MNLLFPAIVVAATAGVLLLSRHPTAPQPVVPPVRPPVLPPDGPLPLPAGTAALLAQYNQVMAQAASNPNAVDLGAADMLATDLTNAGLMMQATQLNTKIAELKVRNPPIAAAGWVRRY